MSNDDLMDSLIALDPFVGRQVQSRVERAQRERDEARAERDALQRGVVAATERAEAAEAERDALAQVVEQVREWAGIAPAWNLLSREGAKAVVRIIDHSPVSLARHDAEVKAQDLDEASGFTTEAEFTFRDLGDVRDWLRRRAAAIRAEAE